MESSTGSPILGHHPLEVRCGICRTRSWRTRGPENAPLLGFLVAHRGSLLFLEEQRLSDRLAIFELDSAFMVGLLPPGHTPATGADEAQTAAQLGYPNVRMYRLDAERTARLTSVGIRFEDLWPSVRSLVASHWPGRHAPTGPAIVFVDEGPGIRRRRLVVNLTTEGVDAACRVGRHHHRIPADQLLRLIESPQRDRNALYLPG